MSIKIKNNNKNPRKVSNQDRPKYQSSSFNDKPRRPCRTARNDDDESPIMIRTYKVYSAHTQQHGNRDSDSSPWFQI